MKVGCKCAAVPGNADKLSFFEPDSSGLWKKIDFIGGEALLACLNIFGNFVAEGIKVSINYDSSIINALIDRFSISRS